MNDLLTSEEVAALLRKSPDALRWMTHAGTAPRSARIGKRRYWRRADVEAWISEQFEKTA